MNTFDIVLMLISLLGGLAMFLYGMEIMGDGLKQGSGEALKKVLGKLTQNVVLGVITGALVTAVIQSSTATIVLTVGLIGAGILNLRQAVSIVMGANIGTTVTAQIIRLMDIESSGANLLTFLKPTTLAPVALIAGIIMVMFIKSDKSKTIGTICMGFGILFIGLNLMTDAVEPLSESAAFANALGYFSSQPILGILVGLVLTVIVQSSSAMVGILQALSSTGAMDFNMVYPVIMGINIGTCVTTAMVCSIGSCKDSKRTGVVHITFNIIGTVMFMIAMTIIKACGGFPDLWDKIVNSGDIANFQTLFNLVTAVVLVPFAGLLVKLACKVVRDDPVVEKNYPELQAMDDKLMISPAVALAGVSSGATLMMKGARDNLALAMEQFKGYDPKRTAQICEMEDRLDHFTDRADAYLIELSQNIETERDNRRRSMLMQSIRDIERIGDYATNLDEMAKQLHDNGMRFSETAWSELDILFDAIQEILGLTVTMIENDDESAARRIEPLEEVIDDIVMLLKTRHTARLCEGKCAINSGLIFMDILTYVERAADQCSSIAVLLLGLGNVDIMRDHHGYLSNLHATGDRSYQTEHANRWEQYMVPLENIKG